MTDTFGYLCESNTFCDHRIPDEDYKVLNDWRRDKENGLRIVHYSCIDGNKVLNRHGVYRVVRADDSGVDSDEQPNP